MSLLAPLFLIGLASIALPVWLHRLNTRNPVRQRFSSAMLLEQTTQQTYIKKELQYLLLLALRILFLLLLVFAFAKPLISKPPVIVGGEGSVLHMLVIDTSFSMNYGDWFNSAKTTAGQIISEIETNDLGQIISASNNIELLTDPSNIMEELTASIDSLGPGFGRLDMGILISNLDRLVADYGKAVSIHLISDFQESALPSKFADLIPDSLKNNLVGLSLHPVTGEDISNLFVATVERIDSGLEVIIRGNIQTPVETEVELQINSEMIERKSASLSDSGLAILQFSTGKYIDGENRIEARITDDDKLVEDNIRFAVINNTPPRPVLLITSNIDSLAVKYLTAAVETGQQGFAVEPVSVNSLDPRILQRYPWIIVDDLGIINETLAPLLQDYLNTGGAVFAALGDRATSLDTLPVINIPVRAARLASDIMEPHTVARIDLSHPALAETSGWRDIKVSRFLNLQTGTGTDVLVSLEDGSPLVVERKLGRGRMLILTSSLDNKQSDIPIRPVFVNFIAEAGKYLSGEQQLKQHQIAGDYLQLLQTGSAAGQVIDPQGRNLLSLAETHRSQDIKLNHTGFYEIYTSDSETLIAVNADLRESELSIMSNDAISAWRQALTEPALSETQSGPLNIEQDSIEIWHILLLLMGIVVLTESLLGNRYLGYGRGHT
jgi:hypothetical protein